MSGPIGRAPRGLLDFFQLTVMGRNPSQLSDTIAMTMDAMRWYVDGQSGDLSTMSTLLPIGSATGDVVSFGTPAFGPPLPDFGIVPSNEVWLMRSWTIDGQLLPTSPDVIGWIPVFSAVTDSIPVWIPPHQRQGSSASVLPHTVVEELPMLIPPGFQLGMRLQGVVATTATYTVRSTTRITRLHI